MTKVRVTFDEFVKRAGSLPMSVLASGEDAARAADTSSSAAAARVAATLVGGLPGASNRVVRLTEKVAHLVALEQQAQPPVTPLSKPTIQKSTAPRKRVHG